MSGHTSDEDTEKALKKARRFWDPNANSIEPPRLEGSGLGKKKEETRNIMSGEESEDSVGPEGDEFYEISSDEEEDTTEGEITDNDMSA